LNSTIAANTAADGGGGIYNLGDGATANLTLNNTIVANSASGAIDVFGNAINSGGANSTSGVGNLIVAKSGFSGTIVTSADPQLASLGDIGGPTQTMALGPSSPAINAANAGLAPAQDQRGFTRAAPDIGAFEFLAADVGVSVSGPSTVFSGNNVVYTVTVTNNGPNTAYQVKISDDVPAGTVFVSQTQTSGPAFTLSNPSVGATGTIFEFDFLACSDRERVV